MSKQEIAVTTDCVVFYKSQKVEKVLLVKRKSEPFKDKWGIPGGFLEENETLEDGAKRELEEETGLKVGKVYQLRAFGTPGRDPRGRTISIAFWGEAASEEEVKGNDDASDARWFNLQELPELAFDHQEILEFAVQQYHSEKTL
ncbi:NUDIX domain-containing protein [Salinimicrobium flavum]|uniref:NUDIX domain-containing protein n=1 Tax=Salinimicrobium flavum TaxID=1737065 RepID=A0ABW5IYL1_9FLAO